VSLLSLALTIFFAALAQAMGWHYFLGLAMTILVGPVLTFLLLKAYAFGKES
jgi:multisubunit Na+/H+ antiporter MnhG subunit